jgi:hypothetical protein
MVVDNDVCPFQPLFATQGHQAFITGPGTDQRDFSGCV